MQNFKAEVVHLIHVKHNTNNVLCVILAKYKEINNLIKVE